MNLNLEVLSGTYAICRQEPRDPFPGWAMAGELWSLTQTDDEISIVCETNLVPEGVLREGPWRALKVAGPLDFALVGILADLTRSLAEADISIFALSTYDTDYLLVKSDRLKVASDALRNSGHTVTLNT